MTQDKLERLIDAIKKFDTAMLVTHDEEGLLRTRPLRIMRCDDDGTLWFVTARESGKVFEIRKDARVNVVLQSGSRYVSVSGTATVDADRTRVAELWHESLRPWFPGGKDDESAVALRVDPITAEYWDTSGQSGMRYWVDALEAVATGSRVSEEGDSDYHISVGTEDKRHKGLRPDTGQR